MKAELGCCLITDCVTNQAGGLYNSVASLGKSLQLTGVSIDVFSLIDSISVEETENWEPLKLKLFPRRGPRLFGLGSGMTRALMESDCELAHTQGIWQGASLSVLRWSRKTGKQYLVSPRGMLDPWALANSSAKKFMAGLAFENAHLRNAACIHCLCASELAAVRARGLVNPTCVIPNGIFMPEIVPLEFKTCEQEKLLLFLGRLHPKKGLPNALRAWAKIKGRRSEVRSQEDWRFVITGWDQNGHEAELKLLCKELGLAYADVPASDFTDNRQPTTDNGASIIFTGPAFGKQKNELLRRADAFILPSFSEGLPMSVLEAWSYGVPVVMTDECNLPEGFTADAALRIGTDVKSIAEGIRLLQQLTSHDLQSLGLNGRALVKSQFSWPMIAAQMKQVYEWVLGGGDLPSCVVIS